MTKILADKNIKKILGQVIIDADEKLLKPNSIQLRLGKEVYFHSTSERKELTSGMVLQVNPSETVSIASLETIDFTTSTVQAIMPNKWFFGMVTPTETISLETISPVKIDTGYKGKLNWSLHNSSSQKCFLRYGHPLFNLTIYAHDKEEFSVYPFEDDKDIYHKIFKGKSNTNTLKSKIVSSDDQLSPKKQYNAAKFSFNNKNKDQINTQGMFEYLSNEIQFMRKELAKKTPENIENLKSKLNTKESKIKNLEENLLIEKKKYRRHLRQKFIKDEIKEWRKKSWRELAACILSILIFSVIILVSFEWNFSRAIKFITIARTNTFVSLGLSLVWLVFTSFIVKSLYDKYRNHSNIENFKKSINIPERFKES